MKEQIRMSLDSGSAGVPTSVGTLEQCADRLRAFAPSDASTVAAHNAASHVEARPRT